MLQKSFHNSSTHTDDHVLHAVAAEIADRCVADPMNRGSTRHRLSLVSLLPCDVSLVADWSLCQVEMMRKVICLWYSQLMMVMLESKIDHSLLVFFLFQIMIWAI